MIISTWPLCNHDARIEVNFGKIFDPTRDQTERST